jgi:hypothetical protein
MILLRQERLIKIDTCNLGGPMAELRNEPRTRVEHAGWIVTDDSRRPCIVSNLSGAGAKLTLLNCYDVPDDFTLSIEGTEHRCQIVWRTRFHAGVAFVSVT